MQNPQKNGSADFFEGAPIDATEMLLPKGSSRPRQRQKRAVGGRFAARAAKTPKIVAVNVRRQTPEEGRQYTAALNLLLAEIVRQELDRGGTEK
jgi:hypothetical protein